MLVEEGKLLRKQMDKSRISETDILRAARTTQGLERMDQIKYVVLDRARAISIIPRSER